MKAREIKDFNVSTDDAFDPLGPVTYSEAQGRPQRPPESLPVFTSAREFQAVCWDVQARTGEAKALVDTLMSSLRLETEDAVKGKRGPKASMSDADALGAFLGSLLRAAARGKLLMHQTTPSAFSGGPVGERTFRRIKAALEMAGLIETWKGWKYGEKSEATKFNGTPALFRLARSCGVPWEFAGLHFAVIEDPEAKARPPVVIRPFPASEEAHEDLRYREAVAASTVKANSLAIPDTEEARAIVAQVEAFNDFVRRFRIECTDLGGPRTHHPVFQRIYHGNFRHQGRLYDPGGYQGISGADRAAMTIDGEATLELDVHASGLTVAHGLVGMPLPLDREDLYELPGISREAAKRWIVASLGKGAPIKQWPRGTAPDIRDQYLCSEVRDVVLGAYPFLRHLARATGAPEDDPKRAGFVLANLEANAVLGAVYDLMAQGILALPIHDSLVVPKKHQEAARAALARHYKEVTGVSPRIRTKGVR